MLAFLLVVLVVLWLMGELQLPFVQIDNFVLFAVSGHNITLYDVLILIVALLIVNALPRVFRIIVSVALVLWLLSLLGVLSVTGLSTYIILAIIIMVIAHLLGFNF